MHVLGILSNSTDIKVYNQTQVKFNPVKAVPNIYINCNGTLGYWKHGNHGDRKKSLSSCLSRRPRSAGLPRVHMGRIM